jgi:hypothetical protein
VGSFPPQILEKVFLKGFRSNSGLWWDVPSTKVLTKYCVYYLDWAPFINYCFYIFPLVSVCWYTVNYRQCWVALWIVFKKVAEAMHINARPSSNYPSAVQTVYFRAWWSVRTLVMYSRCFIFAFRAQSTQSIIHELPITIWFYVERESHASKKNPTKIRYDTIQSLFTISSQSRIRLLVRGWLKVYVSFSLPSRLSFVVRLPFLVLSNVVNFASLKSLCTARKFASI